MNDADLIDTVAKTWVSNGGDDIGFDFTHRKIRDRISEIMKETQ